MKKIAQAIAAFILLIVFAAGCTNPKVPKNNENHVAESNHVTVTDSAGVSQDNNEQNAVREEVVVSEGVAFSGHAYVDLGLPSGTLWATCNVGANTFDESGDLFAWGETTPKATYSWSNYKLCKGSEGEGWNAQTKYCNNAFFGYKGFTDKLTVLQSVDDAATVNWGDDWCMPTVDQWRELMENTESVWMSQNGVDGRLFTAQNGTNLFLPAAGFRWDDVLHYTGDGGGFYWSSSLSTDKSGATDDPNVAWNLRFYSGDNLDVLTDYRGSGQSVRPVCSARKK